MKIIQQTPALLECKRSNWIALIVAFVLISAGTALLIWGLTNGKGDYAWLWGLMLLGIGVITLLLTRSVTLTIDKSSKLVRIQRHNLVRGTLETTFPFNETREVVVDERIRRSRSSSNNEPREQFTYFLIFQKHTGAQEGIDITPAGSTTINGISTDRFEKNNRVMEFANVVASYIGVPCVDKRAPTFGEAAIFVDNVLSNIRAGQEPT